MSKPTHPSARTIRAGQTLYFMGGLAQMAVCVESVRIGSHNTPSAEPGCIENPASRRLTRLILERPGEFFYSRKRAKRYVQDVAQKYGWPTVWDKRKERGDA